MKKIVFKLCSVFIVILMSLSLTTCDLLDAITGGGAFIPSTEEMVAALKEALTVGSGDAGAELSQKDAFYGNLARRIPLPPEAQKVSTSLNSALSNSVVSGPAGYVVRPLINALISKFTNLLQAINASAEDASKQVGPIFANAITSMTINDAITILKGDEGNEATEYLRETTLPPLVEAFAPVINTALDQPFVGNTSALMIWKDIIAEYKNIASNPVVSMLGLFPPIENEDIGVFILDKALTAVFNEMGEVEKRIRDDPLGFLSDLFGGLSDAAAQVFNWAKQL